MIVAERINRALAKFLDGVLVVGGAESGEVEQGDEMEEIGGCHWGAGGRGISVNLTLKVVGFWILGTTLATI